MNLKLKKEGIFINCRIFAFVKLVIKKRAKQNKVLFVINIVKLTEINSIFNSSISNELS